MYSPVARSKSCSPHTICSPRSDRDLIICLIVIKDVFRSIRTFNMERLQRVKYVRLSGSQSLGSVCRLLCDDIILRALLSKGNTTKVVNGQLKEHRPLPPRGKVSNVQLFWPGTGVNMHTKVIETLHMRSQTCMRLDRHSMWQNWRQTRW